MKSRILVIGRGEAGQTLAVLLRKRLHCAWSDIVRLLKTGQVRLGGTPCRDPKQRLRPGQRLEIAAAGQRKEKQQARSAERSSLRVSRSGGTGIKIVFVDAHIIVVDKPAGLTTVRHAHEAAEFGKRGQRFLPATLVDLLPDLLAGKKTSSRERIRAVHRLDKETSGLLVLARTPQAERHLGQQFRRHSSDRRYLALVRGQAKAAERIESYLAGDRGDGRRGSTSKAREGQRAVTHVRLIEELGKFSLVECRLETGRTHQVRIHLGERGTPLCGERVYDRPLRGLPFADTSGAKRPALHAAYLAVTHPVTGKRLEWTSPLPQDMRRLLVALRGRS
jgi:23S rRNA pseudouridine1911/1915/1917 synthase